MAKPAALINIQPDPDLQHTTQLIISKEGDFTAHLIGCAGSLKPSQRAVARTLMEVDATVILNAGDTMYPDGHNIKGIGFELSPDSRKLVRPKSESERQKYQQRLEKLAEEVTRYFPNIYSPQHASLDEEAKATEQRKRRLMIVGTGNHEAGAEGLLPVTDPILMLTKLQAMSDAINFHNRTSQSATILLSDGRKIPQLSQPHVYQVYKIARESFPEKPEILLITIESTTLCLPEGKAQREWLQQVVIPTRNSNPQAKVIVMMHHAPHLTTGRRAFSTHEGKYLEEKKEIGNQHTRVLKRLGLLGFSLRNVIIACAHEHTASCIIPPLYPIPSIADSTPLMVITSGKGGATSNPDDFLTGPLGTIFTQTGDEYYGFFSVQISAEDPIALNYYVTRKDAIPGVKPSLLWQQTFSYQTLRTTREYQLQAPVYFPKAMLENKSAGKNLVEWYMLTMSILRSGELHLLRYLIAGKGDYYRDTIDAKAKVPGLLPFEALRDFVAMPFSSSDEKVQLQEFCQGLLTLIQYYPQKHGTVFLRQLCLIYNMVQFALRANITLAALTEELFNRYFKQSGNEIVETQIAEMQSSARPVSSSPPGGAATPSSSPVRPGAVTARKTYTAVAAPADDELSDDEGFNESTEARPDMPIKVKKTSDKALMAAKILEGQAGKEATEISLYSRPAFMHAIAQLINQVCTEEVIRNEPIAIVYLQNPDFFDEDSARLFLMYETLATAQDQNFLNIFRAAFEACSTWMKQLLLDYLAGDSQAIFNFQFEQLSTYAQTLERTHSDQAEIETQRAYLQHWLLNSSQVLCGFSDLFEEKSLKKMAPTYKAIPASIDAEALLFLWFQQLNEVYTKYSYDILLSFMRCLKNTAASQEGQEVFLQNFLAERDIYPYFYTSDSHKFFPKAVHRIDDSKEHRAFKRILEMIITRLPKDPAAFSALVKRLKQESAPFQKLQTYLPKERQEKYTADTELTQRLLV